MTTPSYVPVVVTPRRIYLLLGTLVCFLILDLNLTALVCVSAFLDDSQLSSALFEALLRMMYIGSTGFVVCAFMCGTFFLSWVDEMFTILELVRPIPQLSFDPRSMFLLTIPFYSVYHCYRTMMTLYALTRTDDTPLSVSRHLILLQRTGPTIA